LCTAKIVKALDYETVCYVYQIACASNAAKLKHSCKEIIKQEFHKVQCTETYETLSGEDKKEIDAYVNSHKKELPLLPTKPQAQPTNSNEK
jgi:hypothetical protein